jgi:hypothetical protein
MQETQHIAEANAVKVADGQANHGSFVIVKQKNGYYVKYPNIEAVPAEAEDNVLTSDEIGDMRKEDVESIYSILTGTSPKTFKTQDEAVQNVIYAIEKMDSVKQPKFEAATDNGKQEKVIRKETRRAPTMFTLNAPQGLGNQIKNLAPQARTIVEILVEEASKDNNIEFSEDRIHELLGTDENKKRLNTRQIPSRIFQYYRQKIMSLGLLREA